MRQLFEHGRLRLSRRSVPILSSIARFAHPIQVWNDPDNRHLNEQAPGTPAHVIRRREATAMFGSINARPSISERPSIPFSDRPNIIPTIAIPTPAKNCKLVNHQNSDRFALP